MASRRAFAVDGGPAALARLGLSALVVLLSSLILLPAAASLAVLLALGVWVFLRPAEELPDAAPERADRAWSLGLLAWSLALCCSRLDSFAPGPGFVESTMAVVAKPLLGAPYVPHVSEAQAPFPSLIFYQGLAATEAWGWHLGALRLPAALWGALSVPLLYLVLRAFAAPLTAGVFALLFSVNNLFLCESRLFFPGSLLWFGVLGAVLSLRQGLRDGLWWRFALAGLCAGLCLHGYIPGRLAPPILLAWLLSAWIPGAEGPRARFSQLAVFAGAAFLAALPVLLWARQNPELYFFSTRRYGAAGILDSLAQLKRTLPDYAAVLFRRADGIFEPTDGLAFFPVFRPDLLGAVALPLGLLACARAWRKPWARLILLGFFGGFLPAALAGDGTHPNTRRALLMLPFALAAGAWAWESLRASAGGRWQPWLRRALIAGAALGVLLSLHQYFFLMMGGAEMRDAYYHQAALIDAQRRQHPGSHVRISMDLGMPRTHQLVYAADAAHRRLAAYPNFIILDERLGPQPEGLKHFDDFLAPQAVAQDQLWLLAPYLVEAKPLLQALFPQGVWHVDAERRAPGPAFPRWDKQAPFVQVVSFATTAREQAAYRGLVDLGQAPYAPHARVDAFSAGFGVAQRGKRLDLGGAWITDGGDAVLRLPWPGWRLELDGAAISPGRAFHLDPGAHRVRLKGSVPAGASGALPLSLTLDGFAADAAASLAPIDPRFGFDAESADGSGHRYRRWELLPSHRYQEPEGLDLPATLRWRGRVQVPEAGPYRFRLAPSFDGRLELGGQAAAPGVPDGLSLTLKAGQALPLAMDGSYVNDRWQVQTAYLQVWGPGDTDWKALPFDWAFPPNAFTRP
jgi:hypothetical protein